MKAGPEDSELDPEWVEGPDGEGGRSPHRRAEGSGGYGRAREGGLPQALRPPPGTPVVELGGSWRAGSSIGEGVRVLDDPQGLQEPRLVLQPLVGRLEAAQQCIAQRNTS